MCYPSHRLLNDDYLQLKGGEYVSGCCVFFTGECSSAIGYDALLQIKRAVQKRHVTALAFQASGPCCTTK